MKKSSVFCIFMHFLKKYEKTAIYNITALLKTTKLMHKTAHNCKNIHQICMLQKAEKLTYIKTFVQSAKGKHKNVTMFLYCHQREAKKG